MKVFMCMMFWWAGCKPASQPLTADQGSTEKNVPVASSIGVDSFALDAAKKLVVYFETGLHASLKSPHLHASLSLLVQGGFDQGKSNLVKSAFTSLDLAKFPNPRVDDFILGLLWAQAPKAIADVAFEADMVKYLTQAGQPNTVNEKDDIMTLFIKMARITVKHKQEETIPNLYIAYLLTQYVQHSDKIPPGLKTKTVRAYEQLRNYIDNATQPGAIPSLVQGYINAGWKKIVPGHSHAPVRMTELRVHESSSVVKSIS